MECNRGDKACQDDSAPVIQNFEKVDQASSSHNVENVSIGSIVSEDEGDNSYTDDQASTGNVQSHQTSSLHDDNDVWAPLKVAMGKKFYPRISHKSLDSIAVFLRNSIDTFGIASEKIGEADDDHDRSIPGRTHVRSNTSNHHSRGESVGRWEVRLSEVFLNFVKDEGDSADDEVSKINPLEWTAFETDSSFLSVEISAAC